MSSIFLLNIYRKHLPFIHISKFWLLSFFIHKKNKNKYRQKCVITGRKRSVYNFFGLSRHVIREAAGQTLLSGLQKSSW